MIPALETHPHLGYEPVLLSLVEYLPATPSLVELQSFGQFSFCEGLWGIVAGWPRADDGYIPMNVFSGVTRSAHGCVLGPAIVMAVHIIVP